MLDIRQLHYFVAVAEDEHVGRAAERLHRDLLRLGQSISRSGLMRRPADPI